MKPLSFAGQNLIMGIDQKEYLPLPAHHSSAGTVTTCWRLSLYERLVVLITGKIWLQTMTFNHPLQPQLQSVDKPQL